MDVVSVIIMGSVAAILYIITQNASESESSVGIAIGAVLGKNIIPVSQIAQYAASAGFSGDDLATAVAIALAESSGDANAKGDLALGVSIGLWQINLRAHPEYDEQSLYDPQTNANAAFAIYNAAGQTFAPWSTYKNGAYLTYANTATVAAQTAQNSCCTGDTCA